MPSIVHMLSVVVVAAVAVGTLAVYYTLNGGEQLQQHIGAEVNHRRRRRRSSTLHLPTQERPNLDHQDQQTQNQSHLDNPCGICNLNIQNTEYDLTTLPCNHNFHCRCISNHLHCTAANDRRQSGCPICGASYSIENI